MEDFAPFELAVKLKEKGFPQDIDTHNYSSYYLFDGLRHCSTLCNRKIWWSFDNKEDLYFAPTISQVLKWLREEKKIHICVDFDGDMNWYYQIAIYGSTDIAADGYGYNDYEISALAGIECVLNNFI